MGSVSHCFSFLDFAGLLLITLLAGMPLWLKYLKILMSLFVCVLVFEFCFVKIFLVFFFSGGQCQ